MIVPSYLVHSGLLNMFEFSKPQIRFRRRSQAQKSTSDRMHIAGLDMRW